MILQHQIDKYASKRTINGCVYKLTYGGKYLIIKGKTLAGSLFFIQKGYGWYDDMVKNPLYGHFYKHIQSTPGKKFTVRILLHSRNNYNLLKKEQSELDKRRYDVTMLNNSIEAYIPIYRESTDSYGWIDKMSVMRFKRYLNSATRQQFLKDIHLQRPTLAKSVL